jgi:hypothetical protein
MKRTERGSRRAAISHITRDRHDLTRSRLLSPVSRPHGSGASMRAILAVIATDGSTSFDARSASGCDGVLSGELHRDASRRACRRISDAPDRASRCRAPVDASVDWVYRQRPSERPHGPDLADPECLGHKRRVPVTRTSSSSGCPRGPSTPGRGARRPSRSCGCRTCGAGHERNRRNAARSSSRR